MRTSAFYCIGAKTATNFSKFIVCPHGQGGEEVEPVQTVCGQGEGGVIFRDFTRKSFMDGP